MSLAPMFIQGIGLLGPGLPSWPDSQATLRGTTPHQFVLTVLPAPPRLPPAERRRAGAVIRLAMAVAEEAIAHAGVDPQTLATVFSSSGGEGSNCHSLCETLASPNPLISPTRFTNSVHNAASGYWHIAVGSRHTSTSLCAYDGSFGAGLIEAATLMHMNAEPLLLVAYDLPYPEPLNSVRPLPDNLGVAMVLTPAPTAHSIAELGVEPLPARLAAPVDTCGDASLDALRTGMPAGAALPMLQGLARGMERGLAGAPREMVLEYLPHLKLRVRLAALGA
jgi:hypothetical protein